MNQPSSPLIFISAGEASGDLHGSNLVRAIKKMAPDASFFGMGGKKMEAAGVKLIARISDMAVVGFTEVISHLKVIFTTMNRLKKELSLRRPDLIILIDYPDFHLPLARFAKKRGFKVMYYISPQIWAWRKGRVKTIRKLIDHMVLILPFEAELYEACGVKCTFVGHPLLDEVKTGYTKEEAKKTLGLKEASPVISLLPGSREKEVERLLPIMLAAADLLKSSYPEALFVIPYAETLDPRRIEEMIASYTSFVRVVPGSKIYEALAASDFAIVASGTATLETALMGIPMCIVYRLSLVTYLIGRMVVRVTNIGLVNIIAGKTLVPELVQRDCTPQRIVDVTKSILDDQAKVLEIKAGLKGVKEKLGNRGAAERAAAIALNMMGHGNV